ncbi:MAG TPA: hypothetical protein VJ987_13945 [Anaerolineales bacterium]|nr:hypothetical protein [Anaerolineales bacterium]
MSRTSQTIIAKDIKSEEQLITLLETCGISSQSPRDVDWLSHWWEKEFEPKLPPLARYVIVLGNENVALDLCIAVGNEFIFYAFDNHNFWFNKLGAVDSFLSCKELNKYLKELANQYLINWKKWMKENKT